MRSSSGFHPDLKEKGEELKVLPLGGMFPFLNRFKHLTTGCWRRNSRYDVGLGNMENSFLLNDLLMTWSLLTKETCGLKCCRKMEVGVFLIFGPGTH